VAHAADEATIKATYRKLARENHPDMLIAQGMPEEFIEVANDKLAAINAAYDKICAQRGIK
jgi:DnaJ like chaperone protein